MQEAGVREALAVPGTGGLIPPIVVGGLSGDAVHGAGSQSDRPYVENLPWSAAIRKNIEVMMTTKRNQPCRKQYECAMVRVAFSHNKMHYKMQL